MNTEVDKQIERKKTGRPLQPKINLSEAIQLRYKHLLSFSDIAKQFKCSPQAVQQALEPYEEMFSNPEAVKAYTDNRVPFLDAAERLLLVDVMSPSKRQKASLNNAAYAFSAIFNARRLESGQSTENIAIDAALQSIHSSLFKAPEPKQIEASKPQGRGRRKA